MPRSTNSTKLTQKKSHKAKGGSKKKVERTKKNKLKPRSQSQSQSGGAYSDTKMLDFMKTDLGFSRPNRKPMPPAPCSIL